VQQNKIYIFSSTQSKITLCSFSSDSHLQACAKFRDLAKDFYDVMTFTEEDIRDFYNSDAVKPIVYRNDGSLGQGFGYYVFKPYIILQTLKRVPIGAIVLYSDCDMEKYKDYQNVLSNVHVENVFRAVKFQNIYVQHSSFLNGSYCKRDVLISMNCDTPTFRKSPQLQANLIALRNTPETQSIINEWLSWCTHIDNLVCGEDDLEMRKKYPEKNVSKYGHLEHETFAAHRHDQAILTCLLHEKKMFVCEGDRMLKKDKNVECFHLDDYQESKKQLRGF